MNFAGLHSIGFALLFVLLAEAGCNRLKQASSESTAAPTIVSAAMAMMRRGAARANSAILCSTSHPLHIVLSVPRSASVGRPRDVSDRMLEPSPNRVGASCGNRGRGHDHDCRRRHLCRGREALRAGGGGGREEQGRQLCESAHVRQWTQVPDDAGATRSTKPHWPASHVEEAVA